MGSFKGKTIVISGGSRGIGLAIALKFAEAQANVAVFTKDSPENRKEAETRIAAAGGKALVLDLDVSDCSAIEKGVSMTAERFGGIDALINNTSATCFANTASTTPEQFDLVIATSVRAAFFLAQSSLPHLRKAANPHILNISPPLHLAPEFLKGHLSFSIGKYAMSLATMGMAAEFEKEGIAINSLWPETTIATQTIQDHFSQKVYAGSRWPSIMADAAFEILSRGSRKCIGQFYTDEALLRQKGITDFSRYSVDPNVPLMQALFIPPSNGRLPVTPDLFLQK